MDKYLDDLCDSLDASVFSGDKLHDIKSLGEFKFYLDRWNKEVKNIEKLIQKEK